MKILSQRNPLWSSVHLGSSNLLMANYGCTTTDLAMLSDYFGCYQDPGKIAHNANNYTKDGLILWNNLKFTHMEFVWRAYGKLGVGHVSDYADYLRIEAAMKDPNMAVLLQVDYGKHWVVGIRPPNVFERLIHKGDYLVADPWTGQRDWAKATWNDITGAAYFERI